MNYTVKDDTGIANVTFWDTQARKLLNKTALELIAELPEVRDNDLLNHKLPSLNDPSCILSIFSSLPPPFTNFISLYFRIRKMGGQLT